MKLSKEESQKYLDTILDHVSATLKVKAVEYIRNEDYMHNFNQGARQSGKLREEVMEDYRLKHIVSRNDLIEDLKEGKLPTEKYILEKYGDIINYYVLEFVSLMQRIDEYSSGNDYCKNIKVIVKGKL